MERTTQAITRLVDDLQNGDEFSRAQAAFTLAMLGEAAIEPLLRLLGHAERDVRMRAAWSLSVLGPAAIPALQALASSTDAVRRVEAIRVLGVIGEARALNALFIALADIDAQVAQRAATALGKIGDPRAFHPLVTALQHPHADVRYSAARSLGMLHFADAIPMLEELSNNETRYSSWGASVAEVARRAIEEIRAGEHQDQDAEFRRISELLHQRGLPRA